MINVGREYVHLALAIDQHMPGYVDAYFGPPEWREQAQAQGARPLAELAAQAGQLAAALADTAMSPQSKDFLTREVRAMQTTLRILQGETMPLIEEVEALYDISPTWIDETVFEEAHAVLDELLPPGDSLSERMLAREKALEIPMEQVEELMPWVCQYLQQLVVERFPLPEGESCDLRFVTDQPWRANNVFLGQAHSRIDINTDLPFHIHDLLGLMAHECYPGHHTEMAIKEARLFQEAGRLEHCVAPLNAPACVVAEGIAMQALDVLMDREQQVTWHVEELFPRAGFSHVDARREHEIGRALKKLDGLAGNAAFLVRDRGATLDEAAAYLQRYGLMTEQEAYKLTEFLANPLYCSYIFCYSYGHQMLAELFAAQGNVQGWFSRLLTEPVTPQQIRDWTAG